MKNKTSKPNIPPPLPDYGIDTVFAFITYVACIAFACASSEPLYSNKINMNIRPDAPETPKTINQKRAITRFVLDSPQEAREKSVIGQD
jgi:hypothetical protein